VRSSVSADKRNSTVAFMVRTSPSRSSFATNSSKVAVRVINGAWMGFVDRTRQELFSPANTRSASSRGDRGKDESTRLPWNEI
jgi:hypothetical protein